MLCALVLGCLDKRAENTLRRSENASGEVVRLRDIIGVDCMFWLISVICVAYYVAIFPFIGLGKYVFTPIVKLFQKYLFAENFLLKSFTTRLQMQIHLTAFCI